MNREIGELTQESVAALRTQLRGNVIERGDESYADARKLYNGMIDKHPALIAQCVDTADVIYCVNFARENNLPLAIRGGGHNGPGFGSVDDGLVIDLSHLKGIRVNPVEKTVRVGGGCLWGEVDHATHPFGFAVPSGFFSTTGVGGLTLGGGVGYLTKKYGLTIDNLLEVDMVLADGSFVTANSKQNPDLFWAVRGGGGNFGVVTSFLFRVNPVRTVYGGPMFWPLEHAPKVMRFWQDQILDGPEDLSGWFGFSIVPPIPMFPQEHHLKKVCLVTWCYIGDLDQAKETFLPIREFIPPMIDFTGPIPWPVLQSLFDPLLPPGLQWYWRTDFFGRLTDQDIKLHMKYAAQLPSPESTMHLYPINGAAQRVSDHETAWNKRSANFVEVIVGVGSDPTNRDSLIQWAQDYWTALHPYSLGSGYVNMMMDEGNDRIKAAYGDNYPRLSQIKAKYDPTNLFHINQNIKPVV